MGFEPPTEATRSSSSSAAFIGVKVVRAGSGRLDSELRLSGAAVGLSVTAAAV